MDFIWEDIVPPPKRIPSFVPNFRTQNFKLLTKVTHSSKGSTYSPDNSEVSKTQNAKYSTDLQKTLLDFIIAYMMEEPNDMIDYAVSHFTKLQKCRKTSSASSILTYQSTQYGSSSSSSLCDLQERVTKDPRRSSVFSESFDRGSKNSEILADNDHTIIPKTDKQRARLLAAIRMCIIFNSLEVEEMNHVVDAMYDRNVNAGDIIIRQGEDGDNFYVIDKGTFDVYNGCNRVDVLTSGTFGEMALLYNDVRRATIQAVTSGKLWVMNRETFRKILHKHELAKLQRYEKLVRTTTVFNDLDEYEILKLVDAFETKYFLKGDLIVKQGADPNGMYFIESGDVALYIDHKDKQGNVILSKFTTSQYFGDMALLTKSKYSCSVYADTDVKCAYIDAASFEVYMKKCVPVFIQFNLDNFGMLLDDETIYKLQSMLSNIELHA